MNLEEYKQKYSLYVSFSKIVSKILETAIEEASATGNYKYNLQHIPYRAKEYDSLKARLSEKDCEPNSDIDELRKDLAGCRIIFYYNTDVNVFLNSGIIQENFKVIEYKIHGPTDKTDTVNDVYTANHFIVELDDARQDLSEYCKYKGLKCEIQIHTILNHALAETAHDITYKKPVSSNFGANILKAIDQRLLDIWEKHLKPAGYEFQKIRHDYQRYLDGKVAFNRNIEKELIRSNDNNQRYDILQEFREYVLPSLDPNYLCEEVPSLLHVIKNTIHIARDVKPVAIQTPFGEVDGKTFLDILEECLNILNFIAFSNLELAFPIYIQLYESLVGEKELESIRKAATYITSYRIEILKNAGFYFQDTILNVLEQLSHLTQNNIKGLVSDICKTILDPTVETITSNYQSVTFRQSSLLGNEYTSRIRKRALAILIKIYNANDNYKIKQQIIGAFNAATRPSRIGGSSDELLALILDDCIQLVDFYVSIINAEQFEILSQIENDVCFLYRFGLGVIEGNHYKRLNKEADSLVQAAIKFRTQLNKNRNFVIYKTLVGYDAVFEESWDNREWHYQERNEYRDHKAIEYVNEINDKNQRNWEEIITICANAQSRDLATFPHFGKFLNQLAIKNAEFSLFLIEKYKEILEKFFVSIIDGLLRGDGKKKAQDLMKRWIKNGEYLYYCAAVYEFYQPINKTMIREVFKSAKKCGDKNALIKIMVALSKNCHLTSITSIKPLFIMAIEELTKIGVTSWVDEFWFRPEYITIINGLTEEDLDIVINNFLLLKDLNYHTEYLLDPIARKNPNKIMGLFKQRIIQENGRNNVRDYCSIPYQLDTLKKTLSLFPDLIFNTVIEWYQEDYKIFFMRGARCLHNIFPEFSKDMEDRLLRLIANNDRTVQLIAIDLLRTYPGDRNIFNSCCELVRLLSENSDLLPEIMAVLENTGVVSGEDGLINAYKHKMQLIEPWLKDKNKNVREFSKRFSTVMNMRIIQETQRIEERVELNKHQYGDNNDDDNK